VNHSPTPGFEDLRITAFEPRISAPVYANFTAVPVGYEVQSWEFANNGTERGLNGVTQTPHAWQRCQTPIWMHLHMSTTGALAAGTVVGFFVSLLVQKIGQDLASAYNPAQPYWCGYTVPVGGLGAKTHIMTTDVSIPATYFGISSMMMLYVFRRKGTLIATVNAGNVTENVNDVFWLHEVDFHVQTDGYGTNNPSSS
jgi:hypothetical protein